MLPGANHACESNHTFYYSNRLLRVPKYTHTQLQSDSFQNLNWLFLHCTWKESYQTLFRIESELVLLTTWYSEYSNQTLFRF